MGLWTKGVAQGGIGRVRGWLSAAALVGFCCGGMTPVHAWASVGIRLDGVAGSFLQLEGGKRGSVSDWDEALAARRRFEAEPRRMRSWEAYEHVMNGFRAIYRGDPGDAHAAAAVMQVAELFAERERELGDGKGTQAAVAQYEYLAKAYPGDKLAPVALERALKLLGPQDADQARKIRLQLVDDYPLEAHRHGIRLNGISPAADEAGSRSEPARQPGTRDKAAISSTPHSTPMAEPVMDADRQEAAAPVVREKTVAAVRDKGPLAVVTAIRHWSTASYTRVAIDLNVPAGQEVRYEAARVENPDRIFFDIEHARPAPELEGKSFQVTDDGFLERVRAAQFSDQVTRVVLDVHQVTQYSAFLLPNPYRLIIDIHGNSGAAARRAGTSSGQMGGDAMEVSTLPPMSPTDGRASFGPAPRSAERGSSERKSVAQPRVMVVSRPTAAEPVPYTEASRAVDINAEVADVSKQPGLVEATRRPTSMPIAETSVPKAGRGDPAGDAYDIPRSRRRVAEVRGAPAPMPTPTADGQTSLMRTLGLKIGRIVIDPGHGGHDSGALGVGGIEEKNVVLDVALRLGRLLHDRLGAEVVFTRDNDTFIPLEARTAIANKAQADLFISVHANSSQDPSASGVEVYYLSFTSDPEALMVASRENAVSTESAFELSNLVKKIALTDKIDESRELAKDVDASMYAGLRKGNPELRNRGVKKAPFVVLIGANMPSILAEISFVTNPASAAEMDTPAYRERIAESLYRGIARYAEGINGVRPKTRTVEQAER